MRDPELADWLERLLFEEIVPAVRDDVDGATVTTLRPNAPANLLPNPGVNPGSPQDIKDYTALRRAYILSQLATVASPFRLSGTNNFSTNRNLITLAGVAPVSIARLTVNGVAYNPPFAYDPELFWDVPDHEEKQQLPPGPNGPVGLSAFARVLSIMSDQGSTWRNLLLLVVQAVIASLALAYVFGLT